MDVIQTIVLALIMSAIGAILAWMLHGARTELRQGFRAREDLVADRTPIREQTAISPETRRLRSDPQGEIRMMREDIRAMRSDLIKVALAVGAKPRAENA